MKFIFLIFYIIFISRICYSENLFDSKEYIINFNSNQIDFIKEKKINEIKIESFIFIIKKIITINNYEKISNKINLIFVNKFILNMTIKNEKIVNNNYYSVIKINFNKNLITDYLINNKINFLEKPSSKFLVIIYDENDFNKNLLTKNNRYYKFLNISKNRLKFKNFTIPKLDFNDRFIFNKYHFAKNNFTQLNKLSSKYSSEYILLIHIKEHETKYFTNAILYNKNYLYPIQNKKFININIDKFLMNIQAMSIEQWKELNQIDVNIINNLTCKLTITNIHELKFIRNLLMSNSMIKKIDLKSVSLKENIYDIIYFGNMDLFTYSLEVSRLKLIYKNNKCNIELI